METNKPIRTLIVDDSRIFRGMMQSVLEQIRDIEVVGSVFSGEKALEFIRVSPPDLVTLDVEMPGIGGIETLREINQRNRRCHQPPIDTLLVSSLTQKGSRFAIEGLQLGAIDYVCKPSEGDELSNRESLYHSMVEKIRLLRARGERFSFHPALGTGENKNTSERNLTTLNFPERNPFRAIAIGTSTGGPEALSLLLPALSRECRTPIFIVQHILDGLSFYLAESLSKHCGRPVREVDDEVRVNDGGIYLAKSGRHMIVRMREGEVRVGCTDSPPERGCRPSVDIFLRSAAGLYGSSLIAVVLTGMGDDGADGVKTVKRAGGWIIAQDESSSVVWGMPRAVVATGVTDEVLPLTKIASRLADLSKLGRDK